MKTALPRALTAMLAICTPVRRRRAKPVFSLCFTRVSAFAVIMSVGGLVSSAFGDGFPSPFFQYVINGLPEISGPNLPGSFAGASCDSIGECQSSTGSAFYINTNGSGTVSAAGTATQTSVAITANAGVFLQYYFGVFGSSNGPVPLQITGSLDTTAIVSTVDGVASAFASVTVFNGSGQDVFNACETAKGTQPGPIQNGLCNYSSSLTFTDNVLVTPNPDLSHLGSVSLRVGAGADGGGASASIDPTISFAPGFDSTGLTLEFSPTPPGSTVPEPGSALLLLSGIPPLVALRRKRR